MKIQRVNNGGNQIRVPLGACGLFAVVDADDIQLLGSSTWYAQEAGNTWYAYRRDGSTKQFMHQLIGGFYRTDHINGDGLDNRRVNLRQASHAQNAHNMRKSRGSSKYKGVCWQADRRRWKAEISSGGRRLFLGRFVDEDAAARAYDASARELFGEFAALNFPRGEECSALRAPVVIA